MTEDTIEAVDFSKYNHFILTGIEVRQTIYPASATRAGVLTAATVTYLCAPNRLGFTAIPDQTKSVSRGGCCFVMQQRRGTHSSSILAAARS